MFADIQQSEKLIHDSTVGERLTRDIIGSVKSVNLLLTIF